MNLFKLTHSGFVIIRAQSSNQKDESHYELERNSLFNSAKCDISQLCLLSAVKVKHLQHHCVSTTVRHVVSVLLEDSSPGKAW